MGYTRLRFPFYMTKEIPLASGAVRLRETLNLHISFVLFDIIELILKHGFCMAED
jgi:hypothetical protein